MKVITSFIMSMIVVNTFAQNDLDSIPPLQLPNAEYAFYQFIPDLQDSVLTYQYHDLWDLDSDNITDSVAFIGNGGAHQYFHLEIQLSSSAQWTRYLTFYIDMPYLNATGNEEINDFYPFFSVQDFDGDSTPEIYLNLANNFASIPKVLKRNGITSNRIIIDCENNELVVKNYQSE